MNNETMQWRECPFCGRTDALYLLWASEQEGDDWDGSNQDFCQVVCDASTDGQRGGCGGSGCFKPTEEEAIAAWNTRAQASAPEVCGRCGASSEAEAETRCIPDGDSCPGCESPLSKAWESAPEGQPVAWMVVQKNRLSSGPMYRSREEALASGVADWEIDEVIPLFTRSNAKAGEVDKLLQALRTLSYEFRIAGPKLIEKQAVCYDYAAMRIEQVIERFSTHDKTKA